METSFIVCEEVAREQEVPSFITEWETHHSLGTAATLTACAMGVTGEILVAGTITVVTYAPPIAYVASLDEGGNVLDDMRMSNKDAVARVALPGLRGNVLLGNVYRENAYAYYLARRTGTYTHYTNVYACENQERVTALTPTADGGVVVAGTADLFEDHAFIAKHDGFGACVWSNTYGEWKRDIEIVDVKETEKGYLLLGTACETEDICHGKDVYLLALTHEGEKRYSRFFGDAGVNEEGVALHIGRDRVFVGATAEVLCKGKSDTQFAAWVFSLSNEQTIEREQRVLTHENAFNELTALCAGPSDTLVLAGTDGADGWVLALTRKGDVAAMTPLTNVHPRMMMTNFFGDVILVGSVGRELYVTRRLFPQLFSPREDEE